MAFGLSYDGSGFHGYAPQPYQRTVAGVVYSALSQLVDEQLTGTCAGRTDAGVHATGQVIHVDIDKDILQRRFGATPRFGEQLFSLAKSLSAMCQPEIAVWCAVVVPDDFDARYSAISRRYQYQIDATVMRAPLRRHVAWQLGHELDLPLLRLASDVLLGEHDFSAFCRVPADNPCASPVRRVFISEWQEMDPGQYRFEIAANAFCHQMVRSIVGALAQVGTGKLPPLAIEEALRHGSRENMPGVAPPEGLCLVEVGYPSRYQSFLNGASVGN